MDLRFVAVMMAIAIIMDMLGRMARKRAAEQQGPPDEEWDPLTALAEGREPAARAGGEAPPARRQQVPGGFELWSETPGGPHALDPVERDPVDEHAAPEPAIRDRAARPIVIRSREPRPVSRMPERAGSEAGSIVREHQPPPISPERKLPAAPGVPDSPWLSAPTPPGVRRPTRPGRTRAGSPEDRLGLGTPTGLRSAIVAREVLGPPLALRDDDGTHGER